MRTPANSAPSPGEQTRLQRHVGLGRLAAGLALAWAMLSLSALAKGDALTVAWGAGVAAATVVAFGLARRRTFGRVSVAFLALYATVLTAATLAAASGAWPAAAEEGRVQLFAPNPNVLGASLVAAFTALAATSARRRWFGWAWPVVALAVLSTGSRTAGAALLVAGTVWLIVRSGMRQRRALSIPLLTLLVLAAAAAGWQWGVVELTRNRLAAPSDIRHASWEPGRVERLDVLAGDAPGPFEGTSAQRLTARVRPGERLVLFQTVGRSVPGVPSVASIHLRAEAPQRVVLSSNLARITCDVEAAWRRCVTPVGYGDGHAMNQLALLAVESGGTVDLYVYGAQYEHGESVTPFVDARPSWLPQAMVNRFDLRRLVLLQSGRLVAARAGIEIWLDHPWFGVGRLASPDAFRERTQDRYHTPLTYAHNLWVEVLAVHGLVGLLGGLLGISAVAGAIPRRAWGRLAPLAVALLILNGWDVTLFAPTVFVSVLLAVAYVGDRIECLRPG